MKKLLNGKKKYLREIEKYRYLYERKNLKYVRNNWIFYWRFLAYIEDIGYRPRTIERFHEKLRTFLNWIGKKSVRKIKKNDIEKYILYLRDEKKITPYALRYYNETIGVFFSFVMRFSKIKNNPTNNLNVRTHYKQPEKMDFFTQEEVVMLVKKPLQVLERIKPDDYKTAYEYSKNFYAIKMHYIILKLMFSTGIRPTEVVNIELEDLMLDKLLIKIRTKGNQQYIMKNRNIFITEKTNNELKEYIAERKSIRTARSQSKLFIHYNGWEIGPNYPNIIIKQWAQKCGIQRKVYAYMIRYTYCSRLVENGIDPYSLRKLMGHKQLEVTLKHYLKLTKTELRKEWREFNPLSKKEAL